MKSALLKLGIFAQLFLLTLSALAQNQRISGKVVSDDDGKPMTGVSITLKGKPGGTQTNSAGEFSLNASVGDVMVVSNTGYLYQEITIGSATSYEFRMKADVSKLGEVIVVGYGTQSRRNVTSAIGKLDKDVLANAPRANIGSALQGTVAGLRVVNNTGTPGASPSILLRGGASINSPGAPLVVVDGIIRSFNDVPADDIASIELLKDAASTAIYGARANNGVILITTKQGKSGSAQVSYKFVKGFNQNRQGYKYLNARDYIYYNRLGNFNSQRTLAQVNSSRGYGLLTSAADLALFDIRSYNSSNAYLLAQGWDTVSDPYGGAIIFKDHGGEIEKLVFRNTSTDDHYISVAGGNDKGKYFASFNYYDEDGVIVGSDYKRYSLNLNGSYKVRPNLEIATGATFSTSTAFGVLAGETNTLYRNLAVWPTMNPWLDSAKTKPNPGNGIADGNPLYWLEKNIRTNEVNRITANASIKYDIIPGLYIKATGNGYLFENVNESFTKATQTYAQIFAVPQAFNVTRPATWSMSRTVQQQFNAIINYTVRLGDAHNVNAMWGAEYFGQNSLSSQVAGTNAPTDDITTVNASTTFAAGSNFTSKSQYRIASHFGRINYDFDARYLLTLVYRKDGVSSLAEQNRWGFFPGMSAGWNLHREKFFSKSALAGIFSSVKPRFSYGVNGNVAGIGDYEVQGSYGSQGNYNGSLGFLNTGIINSGLRWEKSTTTDIGIDIGLLKNRITLMFDYYDRKTSDLLTNLTLPSYTGFGSVRTNLGTFQNTGYEFTVHADILNQPNGLKWDVGANISFVKNKILKLPYNGNENNRQGGLQIYDPKTGKVIWVGGLQEGQTLGDIYGFQQISIFQSDAEVAKDAANRWDAIALIGGPSRPGTNKIAAGDVNWLDVDKNDTIDSRDQVYLGNINPKITGGFSSTLSYKGFTLYTRFDFALGHTIYNDLVARTLGNYQGTFNYIDWQKKGFSGDNSMSDIPRVYYADQVGAPNGKKNYTRANNANAVLNGNNSRFYEKGDYLALRELTVSYDIPKTVLGHTRFISAARAYVNLNNMVYFTKFSGPSPEPASGGIYGGAYPLPRSFVLGFQVNF